jgi:hypothetical protein
VTGAERVLVGAVVGHVALTALHGVAHLTVPVRVPAWQYAYAVVVIVGIPAAGAVLVRRGRPRVGAALLVLSGVAAAAFEGPFHFVVENPDHVSRASGDGAFVATALLTTAGDLLLVVVAGGILLAEWRA